MPKQVLACPPVAKKAISEQIGRSAKKTIVVEGGHWCKTRVRKGGFGESVNSPSSGDTNW